MITLSSFPAPATHRRRHSPACAGCSPPPQAARWPPCETTQSWCSMWAPLPSQTSCFSAPRALPWGGCCGRGGRGCWRRGGPLGSSCSWWTMRRRCVGWVGVELAWQQWGCFLCIASPHSAVGQAGSATQPLMPPGEHTLCPCTSAAGAPVQRARGAAAAPLLPGARGGGGGSGGSDGVQRRPGAADPRGAHLVGRVHYWAHEGGACCCARGRPVLLQQPASPVAGAAAGACSTRACLCHRCMCTCLLCAFLHAGVCPTFTSPGCSAFQTPPPAWQGAQAWWGPALVCTALRCCRPQSLPLALSRCAAAALAAVAVQCSAVLPPLLCNSSASLLRPTALPPTALLPPPADFGLHPPAWHPAALPLPPRCLR